jgi:hypothetical protein
MQGSTDMFTSPRRAPTHLRPAVDDVNLVEGDDVYHLLALLQLALWALHEPGGGACAGATGPVRPMAATSGRWLQTDQLSTGVRLHANQCAQPLQHRPR